MCPISGGPTGDQEIADELVGARKFSLESLLATCYEGDAAAAKESLVSAEMAKIRNKEGGGVRRSARVTTHDVSSRARSDLEASLRKQAEEAVKSSDCTLAEDPWVRARSVLDRAVQRCANFIGAALPKRRSVLAREGYISQCKRAPAQSSSGV